MRHEIIRTERAPSSPTWSQGVKAGPFIFVSGMVGSDPVTGKVVGPTIQAQTRQALANCAEVLSAAGSSLEDVVDVTVLLADPDDFPGMNEAYLEVFPTAPPARSGTKLGAIIPGVLVSIRLTAYLG